MNMRAGEPTEGMVMDFETIKVAWEEHLKPLLDHRDLNEQFLFVTTAENIAAWIIVAFHDNGISVKSVDLYETDTCCATVWFQDVWGNESMYRALTASAVPVGG